MHKCAGSEIRMWFYFSEGYGLAESVNVCLGNNRGFAFTHRRQDPGNFQSAAALAAQGAYKKIIGKQRKLNRYLRSIFPRVSGPIKGKKVFDLPDPEMFCDPLFMSRHDVDGKPFRHGTTLHGSKIGSGTGDDGFHDFAVITYSCSMMYCSSLPLSTSMVCATSV